MDYYVSPKTTWGIVLHLATYPPAMTAARYTACYMAKTASLDSTINTLNNTSKNHFNSEGINLNYTHKFDSAGRQL